MFVKRGIPSPVLALTRNTMRVLTSSQSAVTTAEDFRVTIIGGGCGGQAGGRGGAAGAWSTKIFRGVPIGTLAVSLVGAAGTGGLNGGAGPTAGGTSSIAILGSTVSCTGGQTTGVGGVATGGDININGQAPMYAWFSGTGNSTFGGNGADTPLGFGGVHAGNPSDAGARPGTGYGAGGSGGYFNSGTVTSFTAGDGTQGVIIIEDL